MCWVGYAQELRFFVFGGIKWIYHLPYIREKLTFYPGINSSHQVHEPLLKESTNIWLLLNKFTNIQPLSNHYFNHHSKNGTWDWVMTCHDQLYPRLVNISTGPSCDFGCDFGKQLGHRVLINQYLALINFLLNIFSNYSIISAYVNYQTDDIGQKIKVIDNFSLLTIAVLVMITVTIIERMLTILFHHFPLFSHQ